MSFFYLFVFGGGKRIYNFLYHCQPCFVWNKKQKCAEMLPRKMVAALMQQKVETAHE